MRQRLVVEGHECVWRDVWHSQTLLRIPRHKDGKGVVRAGSRRGKEGRRQMTK
jgi:hypothetical protein